MLAKPINQPCAMVTYGGSSWGWWLPWFPMVDPLRPAPGLAVWPEDNKSNGLTQLPSAKQVELDIQENLVPRRHGRWYCWPRAETRFHGNVNKVK